jgi:hypothetical protein
LNFFDLFKVNKAYEFNLSLTLLACGEHTKLQPGLALATTPAAAAAAAATASVAGITAALPAHSGATAPATAAALTLSRALTRKSIRSDIAKRGLHRVGLRAT